MIDEKTLVRQPFTRLGFTQDFLKASKIMRLDTIADVIKVPPEDLVEKEGFNYSWLGELVKFLNNHKLIHLLQPLPGSNHD